jgi:hypothetical protein
LFSIAVRTATKAQKRLQTDAGQSDGPKSTYQQKMRASPVNRPSSGFRLTEGSVLGFPFAGGYEILAHAHRNFF